MTYILIAFTALISILCFSNRTIFERLQFNAYQIVRRKEIYRMLSHGFVHANWWHLIVNMFVLYFFGSNVEAILKALAAEGMLRYPLLIYMIFYLAAIVFASTISLVRHRDNIWYNSVGASGAVSAIMFFSIFFQPWEKLYLYGMIGIPGILFAALYLIYSQYMSRRGGDNINHDAHFLGAVFGFVMPLFIDWSLIKYFISELTSVF
jgi:membrane associated rhomboid family serine protease